MAEFNYEWTLKDAVFTKDKGKVFSCFACGGGSTMGYKLAGFDVIGCNEIDPKMAECYKANHNPKYCYIEPIQIFKDRDDLPQELYELDILDGSPPCTSFTTSGNASKNWGKKKKFREGQIEQVLDTLFFDFIDLAKKLQPKVVVAENVKGLLMGNAEKYVGRILDAFGEAGYYVDFTLCNAATMGVPQRRERVFFYAIRKDLYKGKFSDLFQTRPVIDLRYREKEIVYSEFREAQKEPNYSMAPSIKKWWEKTKAGKKLSTAHPKQHFFNEHKCHVDQVLPTLRASGVPWDHYEPRALYATEVIKGGAFPSDYNFNGQKEYYIIGMSVPPVMMAQIATRIYEQWLSKIQKGCSNG